MCVRMHAATSASPGAAQAVHLRASARAMSVCAPRQRGVAGARADGAAQLRATHTVRASSPPTRTRRSRCCVPVSASLGTALSAALCPSPGLAVGATVNGAVFAAGMPVLLRGLTPAGVAHAAVLGTLVYSAFGPGGYLLVCLYFLVGSAVTKLRLAQKQAEGIAEARSGRRSPASVWGSGAAGAACAVAALCGWPPHPWIWRTAFVASLASKLGDTTSSEVGKAYGRTTYLVTTLQRVPRGTEGAVSAEGTLAGIAAAACMATAALAAAQVRAARVATTKLCSEATCADRCFGLGDSRDRSICGEHCRELRGCNAARPSFVADE